MALTISSSFDAGNIRVVRQDDSSADLEIVHDHMSDFYQWFYFRIAGGAGRELTLRITNCSASAYPNGWPDYKAVMRRRLAALSLRYHSFDCIQSVLSIITVMASKDKISVLCADDHPLVHDGIAFALQFQKDMEFVGYASSGQEAVEQFRKLRPDVTLMDLQMPGMDGIEAIEAIRSEFPKARIVILTTYSGDVRAARAISAGAVGYLLKSSLRTDLVRTIRDIHQGFRCIPSDIADSLAQRFECDDLTEREIEILHLVAKGNSNKTVGDCLSITEETVKSHMKNVISKLRASDRTHAVQIAMQRGFLALP